MLNAKAHLALMIGGLMFTGAVHAQTDSTQTSEGQLPDGVECIDTDGDGFGWTGTETCLIPDFVPVAGECIDFDGDGFGWNGVETCLIPGFVPTAGECIDFDGDGFGWNGVETCFPDNQPPVLDDEAGEPPVVEAPDSPVTDDDQDVDAAARLAFEAQLEGIRSYGCVAGDEGFFTAEFVQVFSDGLTTSNTWFYEEPECVTRPLSASTLGIDSYVLESPFLTADGREAFKIQYEVLQLSSQAGEDAFPVGTVLFDIIAVEQGGVTQGTVFSTTPEERATELFAPSDAEPIGARTDPASMEGLMHTWQAACGNGREITRVFDEQQFLETINFYADDDCSVDSFIATRVDTANITYGDPVTSVFGQSVMRTTRELIDSQFTALVIDSSLPAPPPLNEPGLIVEDIWAVIDNELVIGTCLDERPGNCRTADNIPNLIDYNVGDFFIRQ